MKFHNSPQPEHNDESFLLEEAKGHHKLILWDDDIHTFDFVIECLIQICKHTPEQAEQCTMFVHYNGKCTVKVGSMEVLQPMCQKLLSCGLTSEVV